MAAIVLLIIGAVGLVGSVSLFSWRAALIVLFVFVFGAGVDLGRRPARVDSQ